MSLLDKINSMKMPFAELKGVTFTEPTDKQAWIDACAPLYAKYAAGLDAFIADIQSYK